MTQNQPLNNPYDASHYDIMCRVGQMCGQALDTVNRLQQAGLDVSDQLQLFTQRQKLADGLKKQFFPDLP